MAHTPGPWIAKGDDDDPCAWRVGSPDHGGIAYLHDPLAAELGRLVELEANARLVAAAPQLLAACKAAQAMIDALHARKDRRLNQIISAVNPGLDFAWLKAAIAEATEQS